MSQANEQTPLLRSQRDVYDRFSPSRKRLVVALVSWCGFTPLFLSGVFTVSIPSIAKEFETTPDVISFTVSLAVLAIALGAMTGATYSTFYGRRPIYLVSLPICAIGSLGVYLSSSVPMLLASRFVQALGASPGMSVGAGTIGDLYRLEDRGLALGIFFAGTLLGPALAPLSGGLSAQYSSWRTLHLIFVIASSAAWLIFYMLFPETFHPGKRGLDIYNSSLPSSTKPRKFVTLNPFAVLLLLRSPNLLAMSLVGMTALLAEYALLMPLAYTIGNRYNISNQALVGLCFLPAGLGNMLGAPLAGKISDRVIKKYRSKRGEWYPEDRLRGSLFGVGVLVPVSNFLAGIIIQYINGIKGLACLLVCLFFNGIGLCFVFNPSSAYCVDVVHHRSAEAIAASAGLRSLILSFAISFIYPSIHAIGAFATYGIVAGISWFGALLLICTIRYGDNMRKYGGIEYSTSNASNT